MTTDSNILAQVLYQDQSMVELIGDVIRPNKKGRAEKRVYLRALKKSTRAPTNVSNAMLAVMCSIFFSGIRNHVLPFLVGHAALEKRQFSLRKRETLASNATVHPPTKTLHDKSRGS